MDLNKIISKMTIDEKLGQLTQFGAGLFIWSKAGETGPLHSWGLKDEDLYRMGSILNFNGASEMLELQKTHMDGDKNKIPMLFMMDVIHGYRTIFPIPLALGSSFDAEMVKECTRMAAKEAKAAGVHVTFTPMVDYVRDARWGRVMETCGEEPMLNAVMGVAQIEAFREMGMATCVKHFAAYGGAEAGRDYNNVELSEHILREFYLPAYKACIDAGAEMLMPSFNILNGVPSVGNKWLMNKILKDEWNFDGIVISDFGAVGELVTHGITEDKKTAAKYAFGCGCDIEMCSTTYIDHLKELVDEGVFSVEQIDKSVYKILKLKQELGLFENPYTGASPEAEEKTFLTRENRELAKNAAIESAVLLKNNGVLPFSKEHKKVALIGPFADEHKIIGFWSCMGKDNESVTVAEGIKAKLENAEITVIKGCGNEFKDNDTSEFSSAVAAAKNADAVILCLGEPQDYSGEGNCRAQLDLPGVQNELAKAVIEANPNTAVVLFTGRPLAIKMLDNIAPAILNMWFPGTEGGSAVADLLFGDANPSGKLTMTFPQALGQCPIYYNHTNTGRPKLPENDDIRCTYTSNYIECGNLPLYSFGHGLSYSNFVYEALSLSKTEITKDLSIEVTVTVSNNSNIAGKETVQLYMRDVVGSTARPIQQLIAFEKIELKAGERKTVNFTITESMLRFWNDENEFVSEKGEFKVSTGYADHLLLTKSFKLI